MMNVPIELPSGKIFNLSRFIALLPNEKIDGGYNLVLEGYSTPIVLEKEDVEVLKIQLQSDTQNLKITENKDLLIPDDSGWNRDEQLQKNQAALRVLKKRRERHQNMDEYESNRRKEFFANFKKNVDSERLSGQKLYSQT